jgi:hypothetical protein
VKERCENLSRGERRSTRLTTIASTIASSREARNTIGSIYRRVCPTRLLQSLTLTNQAAVREENTKPQIKTTN